VHFGHRFVDLKAAARCLACFVLLLVLPKYAAPVRLGAEDLDGHCRSGVLLTPFMLPDPTRDDSKEISRVDFLRRSIPSKMFSKESCVENGVIPFNHPAPQT
jgi:hypothetical protein